MVSIGKIFKIILTIIGLIILLGFLYDIGLKDWKPSFPTMPLVEKLAWLIKIMCSICYKLSFYLVDMIVNALKQATNESTKSTSTYTTSSSSSTSTTSNSSNSSSSEGDGSKTITRILNIEGMKCICYCNTTS